jgi:hypothetical protein
VAPVLRPFRRTMPYQQDQRRSGDDTSRHDVTP